MKLSNHLVEVHNIHEPQQRRHWLDVAKKSCCSEYLYTLHLIRTQQERILQLLEHQLNTTTWIPGSNIHLPV